MGGRGEGGGEERGRVGGGGGPGWHEEPAERETCARAILFLRHRLPRISTSCLAVPTLLRSRCADRRGGGGGGGAEK